MRDVYAELMAMGEGARRPGDRSDISSDEEDVLEKQRREWPRAPVEGATLAIAQWWLEKARKRRAFNKLVTGIIDANKDTKCAITGRTAEMGAKLICSLATNGEPDVYALDRLIAGFELQYGADERDGNLWKAYFRAHAEFITLDEKILDQHEAQRLQRVARMPGPGVNTRPEETVGKAILVIVNTDEPSVGSDDTLCLAPQYVV